MLFKQQKNKIILDIYICCKLYKMFLILKLPLNIYNIIIHNILRYGKIWILYGAKERGGGVCIGTSLQKTPPISEKIHIKCKFLLCLESWGSLGGNLCQKLIVFLHEILGVSRGWTAEGLDWFRASTGSPCHPFQFVKVERKWHFDAVCPICIDAFRPISSGRID